MTSRSRERTHKHKTPPARQTRGCCSSGGSFRIPQFQNSATYSFETIFPVLFEMLLDLLLIASFFFETFLQFIPRLFSRPVQFSFGCNKGNSEIPVLL